MSAMVSASRVCRPVVPSCSHPSRIIRAHLKPVSALPNERPNAIAATALAAMLLASPLAACASGLESVELPTAPAVPQMFQDMATKNNKVLAAAEEEFQNSDLLNILKRNSADNKAANKKAIEDKYCKRQAEMGVGDCGGLQLIPGATQNGLQRTPDWLAKLLGVEVQPETPQFNFFKE